jgi:hypothetical protein
MRREKAPTRSRWFWILVAGLIGFLLGDRHASTWQSIGVSPSQNIALRFPEPMVVAPARRPAPQASAPAPDPRLAVAPPAAKVAVVQRPRAEPKPATQVAADTASRHANRPGFMLNDAQIASIKQRLHLTADQEGMWPAVEAALRNVAYARARDAHHPGAPANAVQLASADPDSVEVQGLKSAAVPLIMSFSDEQRQEVRSLAHVMGLDKLASEL